MAQRVAEQAVRTRRFGPRIRLRVDLHGVSAFGRRGRRSLVRWERIEHIDVRPGDRRGSGGGVVVRSATAEVTFPPGAFGLGPEALAALLGEARSIERRPEVIGRLAPPPPPS